MSIRSRTLISVAIFGLALGQASDARGDDFFDRIMRVLGISATPSQMRGDSDVSAGQVWIADIEHGTQMALTGDSDYRWPVYEPNGEALVALEGESIVTISARNSKVTVLHKIPGVEKLVGFDRKDPDKLLVVLDNETAPLALLSLNTAYLAPLSYNPKSRDHRRILSHVKGQERVYGSARVYVKTESKQAMEGEVEWSEVYLKQGETTPRKVSNGNGVSCGQPSLSPDGKAVVYIRAGGS